MPARPWQLASLIAQVAFGYFYFSANTITEGDTISIAARTYEFHNGAVPVAGDVSIDMSAHGAGPWNAADAVAHAVVSGNNDATRTVDFIDMGGDVLGLVRRNGAATLPALVDTVDATACIWPSGATAVGGNAESWQSVFVKTYSVTAQDVTVLASVLGTAEVPIASFPAATLPRIIGIMARRANAILNLTDAIITARQVNAANYIITYAEPVGGAILQNGDVITLALGVPTV